MSPSQCNAMIVFLAINQRNLLPLLFSFTRYKVPKCVTLNLIFHGNHGNSSSNVISEINSYQCASVARLGAIAVLKSFIIWSNFRPYQHYQTQAYPTYSRLPRPPPHTHTHIHPLLPQELFI